MSVASRYVVRELVVVFVVTMTVLLLVAVGGRFVSYLQDAAAGKYAAQSLLTIIALRMPEFMQLILPFAYFIALLLTLGRLHAEREYVVLQGGGMSTGRLLRWLALPTLLGALFLAYLALWQTPRSNQDLGEFFLAERTKQEFLNVRPGVFQSSSRGDRVIYTETVSDDREELRNVFIWEKLSDDRVATTWAERGRQILDVETGSRFLVLSDGHRHEGQIGQSDFRRVAFRTLSQRVTTAASGSNRVGISGVLTEELGLDGEDLGEFHWRLSVPVFFAVSTLLAVGIARVRPRAGRFAKVLPGLGLLMCYYLTMLGAQYLLVDGRVPAALGMWPAHVLFLSFAIFLLRRVGQPVRT